MPERSHAAAHLLWVATLGCGALSPRYEAMMPALPGSAFCSTNPTDVSIWSDGSILSRFSPDWSSFTFDPPVKHQYAHAYRTGGLALTDQSIEWNGRFTRGDATYNASLLALERAVPDAGYLADIRTPNLVVSGFDFDLMACGWAEQFERFEADHLSRPYVAIDSEWCRALGAPLANALRSLIAEEAATLGAHEVHELRCFGRSGDALYPHIWCEGRAYRNASAGTDC